MYRRPILTVLICYCLVALAFATLGVALVPSHAYADGLGGGEPPVTPPSDSTLDASNLTEPVPVPVTEPPPEKSVTFRMYLEIAVSVIL